MLDTVRLTCEAAIDKEQLRWFWHRREDTPARKTPIPTYFLNSTTERPIPFRATYRPESKQGHNQLLIELSLPKAVFGNNWQLLPDIETGIDAADELLRDYQGLPSIPSVTEMTLSRLDVCCHYSVGELLPHYIEALSRLDYPHRTTVRFNAQTAEFRARSVKCKFYDKHAETKGEAPTGLLRHEATFHKAREIRKALKSEAPVTLSRLTPDILQDILETDLRRLGILDRPFVTRSTAAAVLIDKLGPNRGGYRNTILQLYQNHSRQQIADLFHQSLEHVNMMLADIRKADLSLALSEYDEALPALQVGLRSTLPRQEILAQTPGVTLGGLGSPEAGCDQ